MKFDHHPHIVKTTFDQAVQYLESRSVLTSGIAENKIIQGIKRLPVPAIIHKSL